jgi:dihydroxy-acid dehydratase
LTPSRKTPAELRSARWFAPDDLRSMGHRSRFMQMGYGPEDWTGKPVIAVVNTWSDVNQCHGHFKQRVDDVKRGVLQAGGFPVELPAISLSEPIVKPTTMLYRNLLAMEAEELLRSHPVDGAVLMGGCDKTTPGLIMGALSMGLPFVYLPAGPMVRGQWRGQALGSGTDAWKYWDEKRAGRITSAQWQEVEAGIVRSHGTCMTMGTAATMMGIAEACGFSLPASSAIPAVDAAHMRMSAACGRRAVEMVWEDLTPARMLTREHFLNGITCAMAMGCSTNAIIHLVAMSRRAGAHCAITLDDFDAASRRVPVLANIRPSGERYLMDDFFRAGGLPALLERIRAHLHTAALTVNGRTLGDNISGAEVHDEDVIRPIDRPLYAEGALAVLKGNLAPDGVVIKPSACAPRLLQHTGRALVFDDYPSLKQAVEDPDLDVTADDILVLRYAGPLGGPGMPEWGMLPIPTKLVKQGVRDMLRLSDARMSGTSYGACMLHCAPEAYVGGPLALVRTGDRISVDVGRALSLYGRDRPGRDWPDLVP